MKYAIHSYHTYIHTYVWYVVYVYGQSIEKNKNIFGSIFIVIVTKIKLVFLNIFHFFFFFVFILYS